MRVLLPDQCVIGVYSCFDGVEMFAGTAKEFESWTWDAKEAYNVKIRIRHPSLLSVEFPATISKAGITYISQIDPAHKTGFLA